MSRLALSLCALALASLATAASAHPAAPTGAASTFTANGVTIWYDVRGGPLPSQGGKTPPLVVVNGGPGFDHNYLLISDAWDQLARTRPVVMYDQRGTGRSTPYSKSMSCTLGDQIADLDALRQRLGLEKMNLLGHSWGGYLVMAYTAKHPEHVDHLIISDSAAPKWSDTEFLFKNFYPGELEAQGRMDLADQLGDPNAFSASLREYMGWLCVSVANRDEYMSHMDEYHCARAVNEALNADLAKYDMWPALPAFRCRTLVMTGRHDINVAPSTAWRIHRAIPNSGFVVFEQSGHLPFYEDTQQWLKTVGDFLDERADFIDSPTTPTSRPTRR